MDLYDSFFAGYLDPPNATGGRDHGMIIGAKLVKAPTLTNVWYAATSLKVVGATANNKAGCVDMMTYANCTSTANISDFYPSNQSVYTRAGAEWDFTTPIWKFPAADGLPELNWEP